MTAPDRSEAVDRGLVVEGVSHAYGRFVAVRNFDMVIAPGEVHCLLGPSGSGKSTILRLVAGLETLRQGVIRIGGREVASATRSLGPESRSAGLVFQDYALFPHLDVLHNVQFGMPRGPEPERRRAAEELLDRVGMAEHARAMPHTLSGGQQQRVALARALAREPAVMLLDEPFSGLDARLRRDVRDQTLDVLRAADVATLMVTHDPREALLSGDRITVLRDGRRLQTGPPTELYGRSVSHQVAEVFGPVNRLAGTVSDGRVETVCGVVATSLGQGDVVEVLVRPEGLRLAAAPDDAPDAARVDRLALEGATVLAEVVTVEGQRLLVRDLAPSRLRVGERVIPTVLDGASHVVPAAPPGRRR